MLFNTVFGRRDFLRHSQHDSLRATVVDNVPFAGGDGSFPGRSAEHGFSLNRSNAESAADGFRSGVIKHNAVGVSGDAFEAERNRGEILQEFFAGGCAGEVLVNRNDHFIIQESRVGLVGN